MLLLTTESEYLADFKQQQDCTYYQECDPTAYQQVTVLQFVSCYQAYKTVSILFIQFSTSSNENNNFKFYFSFVLNNPLAPEPAVTGHVKTTPQMPVPSPAVKKKMWGQLPFLPFLKTFWFSYCSIVFN